MSIFKLNLGCGFNQLDGYTNVDKFAGCIPDTIHDLEQTPWPWEDNSVDEIRMSHVLEHIGQAPDVFLAIVGEVYRVLKPNGQWRVTVPHPRHDDFMADPTHVRAILPTTLEMFDLAKNKEWIKCGFATTPLAVMTGIDLVLENVQMTPDQVWIDRMAQGRITQEEMDYQLWHSNNVAREISMVLRARKSV